MPVSVSMGDKRLPAAETNGTHEPSLVRVHAREIWAMLALRLFAISSTLVGARHLLR
jgi:hypothetical protein